jgi:carbohydrate-binding DOMON domain-containing protein
VLNVVAVAPSGATARAVRTVVFDFAPGTLLLGADDPDGDDAGPGNYAYPTSSNFKPGAYDLERFEVYDAGDRIIFRVRTRDLTPTFGSPLGAQLVDLYVNTGGSPVSNAAASPQRNYTVAAGWTKRIEVQGFGQQYVDASGATLGQVNIAGNDVSRFITFSVTKASLGTPASDWRYTVVLTGQDGFSPDQARGFTPTPQDFQFGVCAAPSGDPHCTADPGTVPKAIDVIGGSAQLDYTVGPVAIGPVQP